MDWKAMDEALRVARKIRNKGEKGVALGKLLKEAGINPARLRDYNHAIWEIEAAIRRRCAAELGIVPGAALILRGKCCTVHSVDKDGYVRIQGIRGAFHPIRFIP